jgi:hypothetical protein
MKIQDMPKLESPFVREMKNGAYVVTDKITPDYDWVFNDVTVIATEKLHGTNVSIVVEQGTVMSVYNRTERIAFINKGKRHIIEGILEAYERGYIDELGDGQHFGELIGPKVNGNPYQLTKHVWVPFKTYCAEHLAYKYWGKYPKTFESISEWFKDLQPLYCWKIHGKEKADKDKKFAFVEGIVFHHPDGRMAKLRVDMFDWFTGERHGGEGI